MKVCPGNVIVFEGPDSVGKTTLSREVCQKLNYKGYKFEYLSFPGNSQGTLGNLVYELHHQQSKLGIKSMTDASIQALHVAAHLDAIESRIIPLISSGTSIVLDRFWWSTLAYGSVAKIQTNILKCLINAEKLAWGNIHPTIVFLVHRNQPIQPNANLDHWESIKKQYEILSIEERQKYPIAVLQNDGELDLTVEKAINQFCNFDSTQVTLKTEKIKKEQLSLALVDSFMGDVGPIILNHLLPAKPTIVFDTYWKFAAERQNIFFRKFENLAPPWTEDKILTVHKFTNAYRASDRVSQYLIRHVIYSEKYSSDPKEVFFRILLFKFFNKIETWKRLTQELGDLTWSDYSFDLYDRILTNALNDGSTIYSAAYIMPSGVKTLGYNKKHRNHLKLIEMMMASELPKKLSDASSMHKAFDLLKQFPTIGDFLAYQYVTDINYSEITNFSEMEFVVPGPGALDGIRKCFHDLGGLNEPEIIKFIAEIQDSEFERLGLNFQSLWGRKLQLIDCQNLFCEVDKYARMRHPEVSGISGRTRIKQKYFTTDESISYWYPPKWNINQYITQSS
jgi:thymidylate kinase